MRKCQGMEHAETVAYDDDRFGMFHTADHELFVNEQDVIARRHDTVASDLGSSHALGGELRVSMRPPSVLDYCAEDSSYVYAGPGRKRRATQRMSGLQGQFTPRTKSLKPREVCSFGNSLSDKLSQTIGLSETNVFTGEKSNRTKKS
jgi:hypothetical protein